MIIFLYIIFIILLGLSISFVIPGFTDDMSIPLYLAITAFFAISAIVMIFRNHIKVFKTLSVYIAIFLTLFIMAEGALIYFSGNEISSGNEQAIIVPGSGLFVESRLTSELEERIDVAIEIYSKNPSLPIILSGGRDENRTLPQSIAMESYLKKQINSLGLEMPEIITDQDTSGLYENITTSFEKTSADSAFIIVSRHNVPRTKIITNKISADSTVIGADYSVSKYIIYYIRELWFTADTLIRTGLY